MTAEPIYEYRVVCSPTGRWIWGAALTPTRDKQKAERDAERASGRGGCSRNDDSARHAHHVQRRLVTPWEDCDE